ncbi:MAG: hypothetical protein A2095_16825 [Sphingomonadales bacterium GWF1_63_6]|nr:MAG: hypothetical protein A2095_16825 [Sphingomonadales bacterium GWF1_63_6]
MADRLTLCNNALAEIAADPINSLDERSIGARECLRFYPQVLAEMLTWTEFDFAIRRVGLALTTNDRLGEWLYRYARPSDLSVALRIVPLVATQATNLPEFGPYSFPEWDALGPRPFLLSEGAIYSNEENAILEYQRNTVEEARIDALTARAMELELAARIAMPIKKSRELKGDLIRQAEIARQRAVAASENRNPRRQTDYISPVEYARMGLSV